MARRATLSVGDLVSRVEAPTVVYLVTTRLPRGFRALPYQRTGKEVFLLVVQGQVVGDGSTWRHL